MTPPTKPVVLTIAGSDSSGGAGIQADIKAIAACGGWGASVITAITAQNTRGVRGSETVPATMVRAQIEAVFEDLTVAAVKTGMLASGEIIREVAAGLRHHAPAHVVCDPVMVSKSGFPLLPQDCVTAMQSEMLPVATLVTPNVHEAEALSGLPVETPDQALRAGRRILEQGAEAVLVKGGHLREGAATDVLVTRRGSRTYAGEFVPGRHTHGTGCLYSAAIATFLARGRPLEEAIASAKEFVTGAIRGGLAIGSGVGPADPFYFLKVGESG